jgi:Ca2+-binding RTX toxin-like protein
MRRGLRMPWLVVVGVGLASMLGLVGSGSAGSAVRGGAGGGAIPAPLHEWTFDDGTARDSVGGADGTLVGGATIVNGRLLVGPPGRYMRTSELPETIGVKTLVAWVSLDTLDQGGGSALTIENTSALAPTNYFDAVDFGEFTRDQWTAGSDFSQRSLPDDGGAPERAVDRIVMLAIVYAADSSIAIYRNGAPYAPAYVKGVLQTYRAGNSDILIGYRHSTCGTNCPLSGAVDEARIYGTALTGDQIEQLYRQHQTHQGCLGHPATIVGTPGDDTITGTPGNDVIVGDGGNDTIDGAGGNDIICGGAGNDTIRGGDGNDTIAGGGGTDTLDGGPGNDSLRGGTGNDTFIGGSGTDRVSFLASSHGVYANLATGVATGEGTDSLSGIENLVGTQLSDVLVGDDGPNVLFGAAGDDVLDGAGGTDTLGGGLGTDACVNGESLSGCE